MHKVLILGGDSDHNLGDAAILRALCETLTTARRSNIEITATSARHSHLPATGVRVIPRGSSGTPALLRAAHESDLVIVGGGGLLQDDDSRIKLPYWTGRLALLRLATPRLVGHSLGVGPLSRWESRHLAGLAASTLQRISVRDSFAHGWLSPCTQRPVDIVPDPAFLLTPASPASACAYLRELGVATDRPIIGVALRRWFHRRGGVLPHKVRTSLGLDRGSGNGRPQLNRFIATLAPVIQRLARRLNATVLLMPTYNVRHENDLEVCRLFAEHLGDSTVKTAPIEDPSLYKAVAGRLQLMISARMHPLILAASMGVPIVGLAYNGKFEGLFDLLGVARRMVWLNDFQQENAAARLEQLADDALASDEDLQHRSSLLAAISRAKTLELLEVAGAPLAHPA